MDETKAEMTRTMSDQSQKARVAAATAMLARAPVARAPETMGSGSGGTGSSDSRAIVPLLTLN